MAKPFGQIERFLAWRFIRGKNRESFISIVSVFSLIGILLGVATLIIVMSVMNGFRLELFAKLNGINGHLKAYSVSGDNIEAQLQSSPQIVLSSPVIQGQALATRNKRAQGALVRGIDAEYLSSRSELRSGLDQQKDIDDFNNGRPVAMIGYRLARALGVKVGDSFTLIAPEALVGAFGTLPRLKTVRVIGTVNSELYDVDNAYVFIPRSLAQKLLSRSRSFDYFEILIDDPRQAISQAVVFNNAYKGQIHFTSWAEFNKSFFEALQTERNVMFLILSLIIIVAAFNIISGQIMLVNDKARNIALLRGMGMTKGGILRVFFMTGAFNGIVGAVLGVGLALLILLNLEGIRQFITDLTNVQLFPAEIYYLTRLPSDLQGKDVTIVTVMALALTFLASLYPAWRAARLDPIEILRHA